MPFFKEKAIFLLLKFCDRFFHSSLINVIILNPPSHLTLHLLVNLPRKNCWIFLGDSQFLCVTKTSRTYFFIIFSTTPTYGTLSNQFFNNISMHDFLIYDRFFFIECLNVFVKKSLVLHNSISWHGKQKRYAKFYQSKHQIPICGYFFTGFFII